jgi:hypothetical protein
MTLFPFFRQPINHSLQAAKSSYSGVTQLFWSEESLSTMTLQRWATHSVILGSLLTAAVPTIAPPSQALPASISIAQTVSYQERAEQFVDLVFSAQYDEALEYLHPVLQEATEENSLEDRVERFQQVTGAFQTRLDAQVVENVVLVTTEFENVTDTIVIIFDEEGLITGVDFPLQPLQTIEE